MTSSPAQIALVTGGNRGIGYTLSLTLATKHNYHVLLGARDKESGQKAAKTIEELGGSVEFVQLDVTDDATIYAARDYIAKKFGKLDVLVNNAGIISKEPTVRAEYLQTFNVNVFGPAVTTDAFIELLEKSDNPRIANVSSAMGSIATVTSPDFPPLFRSYLVAAYSSSKSALNSLTAVYSTLLEKKGIKVNSVCPGFTATDINDHKGTRTVQEGADSVLKIVLIEKDGPTGQYYNHEGDVLPW